MDLLLIIRESKENQIEKIPLKTIVENEKINSHKEIFLIHNEINKNKNLHEYDKIIIKKISNKENSMSKNKPKIIHNNKKEINTTLDFDKILYILHNKEPKKKKLLSHKRIRKKKSHNNSESKIKFFY